MEEEKLSSDLLLHAYCAGAFPMGEPETGEVYWYSPDPRAIQPIDGGFHIPRRLAKTVRRGEYEITRDKAFKRVMEQCALPREGREETWITDDILEVYCDLFSRGFAHSVEAWLPLEGEMKVDGALVDECHGRWLAGGIYGVAIGAAFFGESMFSNARDASKVCLVHTIEHLRSRGYELFDVQFVNPHLIQFGVTEIEREDYLKRLQEAIVRPVSWRGD
ncbi:leucyl/phenylalanyl-tRNA--protein transferase [Planctomycetota bacterium]|nr:leucyl/phenylalanyl-tRNA--protein transferase [Planctomycetota bacterium]